jgi:hypothetical protein
LKYDAVVRMIKTMLGAVVAVLLICFYNGSKGRQLPEAFYLSVLSGTFTIAVFCRKKVLF